MGPGRIKVSFHWCFQSFYKLPWCRTVFIRHKLAETLLVRALFTRLSVNQSASSNFTQQALHSSQSELSNFDLCVIRSVKRSFDPEIAGQLPSSSWRPGLAFLFFSSILQCYCRSPLRTKVSRFYWNKQYAKQILGGFSYSSFGYNRFFPLCSTFCESKKTDIVAIQIPHNEVREEKNTCERYALFINCFLISAVFYNHDGENCMNCWYFKIHRSSIAGEIKVKVPWVANSSSSFKHHLCGAQHDIGKKRKKKRKDYSALSWINRRLIQILRAFRSTCFLVKHFKLFLNFI